MSFHNYAFICSLQGKADGQMYVDDYHSYEYKQGAYALTNLSFHNFKLENK